MTNRVQLATRARSRPILTAVALKIAARQYTGERQPEPEFPYIWAVVVSLCVGGLSLLVLAHAVAYDATSWLVWGRQLDHLALSTRASGTSFKPLTVLIDAVLTLAGNAAPSLWLVLVRASTALALALAYHLGRRFQGPVAGLIAAATVFTAHQLVSYLAMEGGAEPLIVVCCLATVDLAMAGRHRAALAWLAAASLLQIDLIGFVILYAILYQTRLGRRHWVTAAVVVAVVVPIVLAWTLPDLITSGNLLRSAKLATHPTAGGPLLTSFPAWAVIKEMGSLLLAPVTLGWCAELVTGTWWLVHRKVIRPLFLPAVAAAVFVLGQAAATQLHTTTGTPRFLLAGAGVVAVVGACFWVEITRAATTTGIRHLSQRDIEWRSPRSAITNLDTTTWLGILGALLIAVLVVGYAAMNVKVETQRLSTAIAGDRVLAAEQADLNPVIASLGGRNTILACGPVHTSAGWEPAVAWTLDLPVDELPHGQPAGNGTLIYATATVRDTSGLRYQTRRQLGSAQWWLPSTCTL